MLTLNDDDASRRLVPAGGLCVLVLERGLAMALPWDIYSQEEKEFGGSQPPKPWPRWILKEFQLNLARKTQLPRGPTRQTRTPTSACVWVRGTGPWVPHLHEVSRARKSTTHWAPRDRGPRRNERARGCSMGSAGQSIMANKARGVAHVVTLGQLRGGVGQGSCPVGFFSFFFLSIFRFLFYFICQIRIWF